MGFDLCKGGIIDFRTRSRFAGHNSARGVCPTCGKIVRVTTSGKTYPHSPKHNPKMSPA